MPTFVGVPGVVGAQAQNNSGGFFSSLFSPSAATNPIGQGLAAIGSTSVGSSNLNPFNAASTVGNAIGTTASTAASSISSYFYRGVVIILGFIFVGIGLSMFRNPAQTVVESTKTVARAARIKK